MDARSRVERDIEARKHAIALAECGIRAGMIRTTVGAGLQHKDVARIYEAYTPLPPYERQGRGFAVSRLKASMSPERIGFNTRWSREVLKLFHAGAHQADAIVAVWRLACTLDQRPLGSISKEGVTAEEFCAVCMSLLSGHLDFLQCNQCGLEYLAEKSTRRICPVCSQNAELRDTLYAVVTQSAQEIVAVRRCA